MALPLPPGTRQTGQNVGLHAHSGHPSIELNSATTSNTDNIHQNRSNSTQINHQINPIQPLNPQTTSPSNQPKMMGTSAPWNPNVNAVPAYPTEETLAAEYRAFLDSYQPNAAPGTRGQPHTAAPLGYGHEVNHKARRDQSRDSLSNSASPYGTANASHYASSDPYPSFNQQDIDFNLAHSQDLITPADQHHQQQQHSHVRRSTVDSQQQQQQQMLALSPESFSSFESPHSVGISLGSQGQGPPQQQQQYFPQDSHPYYAGAYNNAQQQQSSSPNWLNQNNPQIPEGYGYQHSSGPTYANHARPPASYATNQGQQHQQQPGYQQQYQHQVTGVAPSQVSSNAGGRSTQVHVGPQSQQSQQSTVQGRLIAKAGSRKDAANLGVNTPHPPPSSRVSSNGSQANLQINTGGSRPSVKPPPPAARNTKKRQRIEEAEEESDSSDEYYGEENSGQQSQNTGAGGQPVRLPGACAPCKRLKMKCVFPEGQNDCCQRCRNSGRANQCVVGPRKPRQPSNKKELLLQKLREQDTVIKSKDAVIKSLLEQIQNPHVQISLRESPSIASSAVAGGIVVDKPAAHHEETPIDKAILEWVQRAQASIQSTPGYRLADARPIDDGDDSTTDSSEFGKGLGRDHMSPTKSSVSDSGRSAGRLAAPGASGGGGSHSIKNSPKLHSLPLVETPIGLLAELSLRDNKEKEMEAQSKRSRSRSKSRSASGAEENESRTGAGESSAGGEDEGDGALGVANRGYFQPAPASHNGLTTNMLERKNIPEIMTSGLISPAEVDKLFKLYFDRLNVFISILDPILHTPATTFGRCPFLFTVVCAIASRYHTERPELYSIAMHFARRSAASSLIEGAKSVELCQAYILMSVYSMPSRRWEDAREWLYLGLAIRMATDLSLHVKSTTKILNEQHERELLNRTRTWLNLYNLDRSASAQLGRPASIRPDPIIRSCNSIGKRPAWWKSSPINDPFDLHLCAYTDLLSSVTAEFQEKVYWDPRTETTGLRTDLDLVKVAFEYDDKLQEWNARTAVSFATHSDSSSSQCAYRVRLLPFYVNYLRLVMLSLGFQQAVQKGAKNVDPDLVKRCLDAACGVVKTVVEDLAPTDYLRYAPDGHFVFSSFASAFLIKMLRPEHADLLEAEQRTYIINLVERLVDTLKSPRIAVDVRHTPMLYSRFLAGLLTRSKQSENAEMADDAAVAATTPLTQSDTNGVQTPPMEKREAPPTPDLSGGRTTFGNAPGVNRHKPSPSIEISPPPPDPALGMPPPHNHMLYDPSIVDHSLFPPQLSAEESSTASYAASTIHPASTVHGSQYGAQDTMMLDDHILAPMLAMETPGFWGSMMLPGIAWPAEDPMQWGMSLDVDGGSLSHDSGPYHGGDGY